MLSTSLSLCALVDSLQLNQNSGVPYTIEHLPDFNVSSLSTITMRATLALRNAHTPLIRFLGKRSVPRMFEISFPTELQLFTHTRSQLLTGYNRGRPQSPSSPSVAFRKPPRLVCGLPGQGPTTRPSWSRFVHPGRCWPEPLCCLRSGAAQGGRILRPRRPASTLPPSALLRG